MYGRKIVGGKLSFLKPQQIKPLEDNFVSKKVEEIVKPLEKNEKVIVNNNLETKMQEPNKKIRNEKILKFINFQI